MYNKIIVGLAFLFSVNTFAFYGHQPGLYDSQGGYHGNLSANPYDENSINNPYGKYGSEYSSESINNPYSNVGNQYSSDSPFNPYGHGLRIIY